MRAPSRALTLTHTPKGPQLASRTWHPAPGIPSHSPPRTPHATRHTPHRAPRTPQVRLLLDTWRRRHRLPRRGDQSDADPLFGRFEPHLHRGPLVWLLDGTAVRHQPHLAIAHVPLASLLDGTCAAVHCRLLYACDESQLNVPHMPRLDSLIYRFTDLLIYTPRLDLLIY